MTTCWVRPGCLPSKNHNTWEYSGRFSITCDWKELLYLEEVRLESFLVICHYVDLGHVCFTLRQINGGGHREPLNLCDMEDIESRCMQNSYREGGTKGYAVDS